MAGRQRLEARGGGFVGIVASSTQVSGAAFHRLRLPVEGEASTGIVETWLHRKVEAKDRLGSTVGQRQPEQATECSRFRRRAEIGGGMGCPDQIFGCPKFFFSGFMLLPTILSSEEVDLGFLKRFSGKIFVGRRFELLGF